MTRAARYWTFDPTWRQLRLRAIATLPWAGARGLEISQDRRLAMEQALRVGPLADFVTTLSRRRGAELSAADWVHGLNTNSRDRLGLTVVIASPRGTLALWAEVMLAMPGAMDSSVVACAELRVEHLAAWSEAVVAAGGKPSDDMRLSLDEVVEFFNIAGSTANELLPSAITDEPASLEWMAPPTTELRMSAEQRHDDRTDPKPVLADYVNMDAFGFTDRAQPDEMAVTIFASPRLDVARRAELTREAVVFMGRSFGYLDVTEDSFQGGYHCLSQLPTTFRHARSQICATSASAPDTPEGSRGSAAPRVACRGCGPRPRCRRRRRPCWPRCAVSGLRRLPCRSCL